jgi:hypothetical protein
VERRRVPQQRALEGQLPDQQFPQRYVRQRNLHYKVWQVMHLFQHRVSPYLLKQQLAHQQLCAQRLSQRCKAWREALVLHQLQRLQQLPEMLCCEPPPTLLPAAWLVCKA